MTEPTLADIHEMRRYMKVVTPRQEASRLTESVRENSGDRVMQITEHLYRHLQRADTDAFVRALGSQVEAVLAVQAIDGLYEAFREDNPDLVVAYARQLYEKLEYCTPDQIAAILGRVSFRGQELDVTGLVTMLGDALDDLDGRPRHRLEEGSQERFDELVKDLAGVIQDWSTRQPLMESSGEFADSVDYADRLRSLLETKYGIRVEAHRG